MAWHQFGFSRLLSLQRAFLFIGPVLHHNLQSSYDFMNINGRPQLQMVANGSSYLSSVPTHSIDRGAGRLPDESKRLLIHGQAFVSLETTFDSSFPRSRSSILHFQTWQGHEV